MGAGWGHKAQDLTLGVGASPYTHTRGHPSGSKSISAYLWSTQRAPPHQKTAGATQVPSGSREAPHWGARESPGPPFGLQMVMGVGLLDRGEKRARSVPEKGVSGKVYKREPSVAL